MAANTITARIPQPLELEEAEQYQNGASNHAEIISGELGAVIRAGLHVEIDASTAWALTMYARNLEMDGRELLEYAERITSDLEQIWSELREEGGRDA